MRSKNSIVISCLHEGKVYKTALLSKEAEMVLYLPLSTITSFTLLSRAENKILLFSTLKYILYGLLFLSIHIIGERARHSGDVQSRIVVCIIYVYMYMYIWYVQPTFSHECLIFTRYLGALL